MIVRLFQRNARLTDLVNRSLRWMAETQPSR
jgi:hypothetical protein